jgi:diguanylate cyclase (GGDEF)-like protein
VALIDVDDFKAINDLHSHGAGDAALRGIADVLRQSVRDYDVAARLGGDEFVVLFAHSTLDTARQVCERISERVSALRWDDWPALRASISIGVASARPGDTMDGLMQRADACMFRAKERNDGQSLQVESAW